MAQKLSKDFFIKKKRVNNFQVKPVKLGKGKRKHFPGYELFNTEFFTCCLLAPSGTGKTTLLANLLDKMCPAKKHTKYKIWLFVATVHSDPIWQNIIKTLHEKRGYEVFYDTSLEHLQEIIDGINNTPKHERMFKKHIIISGDNTSENRSKAVSKLATSGRHGCCSFIEVHNPMDIAPRARNSAHVWLLFKGIEDKYLEIAYGSITPDVSYDVFRKMYYDCMRGSNYNVFYVSKKPFFQYRKNFDTVLEIPQKKKITQDV